MLFTHDNYWPIQPPRRPPKAEQKLYAQDIATAMEMLTANIDWEIIVLQTGVNHIHYTIALDFGFDVYPLLDE